MSQQHAQFEGEFLDGSQISLSHQQNSSEPPYAYYATPIPPPTQQPYMNMPGQKLQKHIQDTRQASTGMGARVILAMFSIIFVAGMFIVAIIMSSLYNPENNVSSVLAILFAFVFAVIVIIINLIVNLRR